MEIITRTDARAKGLKHFYTGKLCSHGYNLKRYVSTGACVQCANPAWRAMFKQTGGGLLKIFIRIPAELSAADRTALQAYLADSCVPAFLASRK